MNSKSRARLALILGILLFLGGTFWAVRAIKARTSRVSPAVLELHARQSALWKNKDLPKEERDAERKKLHDEEHKMTADQRNQLRALQDEARFKAMSARASRLFSLPRDQWEAQMKKDIEDFQSRWGGGGRGGPRGDGSSGSGSSRQGSGNGGDSSGRDSNQGSDPTAMGNRFKQMLDSTTPEERNQMENYRQMMRAQRIQQQQQSGGQSAPAK